MTGTPLLAVKATAKEHYALVHPSGDRLDAKGSGHWPDDSWTERRRQEGAIRIAADEEAPEAEEPQASTRKVRTASKTRTPAPVAPPPPEPPATAVLGPLTAEER